jgi:hypothetical protein
MAKAKNLTKKQLAVLDELFLGELNEQQVLDKYNVNRSRYYKWLTDEVFAEQFDRRIAASYRQSAALLARYATLAAAKLVQLTESENQETARKACLDIISMQGKTSDPRPKTEDSGSANPVSPLSPETASKILEVLAQEKADIGLT